MDSDEEEDTLPGLVRGSDSEDESDDNDDGRSVSFNSLLTKADAKRLNQTVFQTVDVSAHVNMETQDLATLLAQRKLGLVSPLNEKHQSRYDCLFEERRQWGYLNPLAQPVNRKRMVKGKLAKAFFPLCKLVDPKTLHKGLHRVVPEDSCKNLAGLVSKIEGKKGLISSLTCLETTFTAVSLSRTAVCWDIITRLLSIPLGNGMMDILDTEEKLESWQFALTNALSHVQDEFSQLDILFSNETAKKCVENYEKTLLDLHLERMREYPIAPEEGLFATNFRRSKGSLQQLQASLTLAKVREFEAQHAEKRAKLLGRKNQAANSQNSSKSSKKNKKKKGRKRKRNGKNHSGNNGNNQPSKSSTSEVKPPKKKKKKA